VGVPPSVDGPKSVMISERSRRRDCMDRLVSERRSRREESLEERAVRRTASFCWRLACRSLRGEDFGGESVDVNGVKVDAAQSSSVKLALFG